MKTTKLIGIPEEGEEYQKSDEVKGMEKGAFDALGQAGQGAAIVEQRERKLTATREGKSVKGRPHTDESKAKISAANRGNTPWNKGRAHSAETKAKIAATTRRNAARRREALASAEGLTLQEYERRETEKKMAEAKAARDRRKQGPTNETCKKISEALKARWRDPQYRTEMLQRARSAPNRSHTPETKRRISASIKRKWETDPAYREKIVAYASNSSAATRAKISATLKAKWAGESQMNVEPNHYIR